MSAVAAPLAGWLLQRMSAGGALDLQDFRQWGLLGLVGIAVAIVLAVLLEETGSAIRKPPIAVLVQPLPA